MSDIALIIAGTLLAVMAIGFVYVAAGSLYEMQKYGASAAPCIVGLFFAGALAWAAWMLFSGVGSEREAVSVDERINELEVKLEIHAAMIRNLDEISRIRTRLDSDNEGRMSAIEQWARQLYAWGMQFKWHVDALHHAEADVFEESNELDGCR
jgi:hypothetical protein